MKTKNVFNHIMDGSKFLSYTCLTLVVIGAINWGMIGFFQFDIIAGIFGNMSSVISRIIYSVVGLSGLYCLSFYARMDNQIESRD